jgi:hypothetical protein
VVQVWKLVTLANPLFTLQLVHLNYAIFFISLKLPKISCLFIVFPNNAFFEIHPWFFLIKDRDTRSTLRGKCRDGLYPIPAPHFVKFAFEVNKPSLARWHERLGHPAL